MNPIRYLQQNQIFSDYSVQSASEIDAASQRFDPDLANQGGGSDVIKNSSSNEWRGEERRLAGDRRENDRRNERLAAMLDTRAGFDRRRESRRQTDELRLSSFSCRV